AVKIGGSVEKFADLMNARAAELKMENSHFITPSGLHDDQHYSTSYDMALLARAALQNERFLSICSKSKAKVEFGNPPYTRYLTNHNRLVKEYSGCIGVKTGFTKKAGRCLVSAATRDG
ncbi:MAG: D-alanyl-D-alanine carboxypeptidase, partial [Oscillospiraceae bacterium]